MTWLDTYSPKNIEDLLISKENYNKIHNWLENFKKNGEINCLYLYGPIGCGKTSIAHLFLKHFNYDIIEKNLSNITKKKNFNNHIYDILQKKNIINMFIKKTKEIGLILDEIEGLTLKEIYIFNDLLDIIFSKKNYRYLKFNPFIIISDSLNNKMKHYTSQCVFVEIDYPSFNSIENICKHILDKEQIKFNQNIVKNIIETSRYDIRQIIINLEYSFKKETKHELYKDNYKNIELNDYNYIKLHMTNYNGLNNYISNINKNFAYMLFYENFIEYVLKNKNENQQDTITNVYKNFSDSDIFDFLLYKYMKWDLVDYNNIYKIIHNSYIINNNNNNNNNKIEYKYSLLLNKNSLEFINLKIINTYSNKLFKNSRSLNIYNIVYLLELLNSKNKIDNIDYKDFKKLLKFIK